MSRRNRKDDEVADDDLDLSKPVELAVLSVKERTARCRLLENNRVITLPPLGSGARRNTHGDTSKTVALLRAPVSFLRDSIGPDRCEGPGPGTPGLLL